VTLPPEFACPRCDALLEASAFFGPLPVHLHCPGCGLPFEELRGPLEAPAAQERLTSDLGQLERRAPTQSAPELVAYLGRAKRKPRL